MSEPKCIEVSVTRSGGGSIAIVDYGKWKSDWFISFGRKYSIPEDWDEDQVAAFQIEKEAELYELIDPLDQEQIDVRLKNKNWSD